MEENRSEISLFAKRHLGRADETEVLIEEFRNRVRYLLQLPDESVNVKDVSSAVEAYVAAVRQLVINLDREIITAFIMFDRFLAVAPSIISRDKLNNDDKLNIIEKLESVIIEIECIRTGLSSSQLNDLISLVTQVVYCYKFFCHQYSIGCSYKVINNLYNMPQWMGTQYLSVEGHLKINFSLLCLNLSFDLFEWSDRLHTKLGISFKTYNSLRFILDNALELLKRHNTSFYIPIYQWFIKRIDSDVTQFYTIKPKLEYYDLHDIDRMMILRSCERSGRDRHHARSA